MKREKNSLYQSEFLILNQLEKSIEAYSRYIIGIIQMCDNEEEEVTWN